MPIGKVSFSLLREFILNFWTVWSCDRKNRSTGEWWMNVLVLVRESSVQWVISRNCAPSRHEGWKGRGEENSGFDYLLFALVDVKGNFNNMQDGLIMTKSVATDPTNGGRQLSDSLIDLFEICLTSTCSCAFMCFSLICGKFYLEKNFGLQIIKKSKYITLLPASNHFFHPSSNINFFYGCNFDKGMHLNIKLH